MTKRDMVRMALRHEEPPLVPTQEDFGDDNAEEILLPAIPGMDWREAAIRRAKYLGNYMVGAGGVGFRSQREPESDDSYLLRWETGAVWRIHLRPQWWRHYIVYPVNEPADLERLQMPDPADGSRYQGLAEDVHFFQERGYFTIVGAPDVFASVWYHIRPFEEYLIDMVERPAFARELMARVGEYALASLERLLPMARPDAIGFAADMGHNRATFMSPRTFERLLLPWYARYCEVAHKHGAYVCMHSHGNINAIMPMLCEAGVDCLNPVGPGDGMDLAQLKRDYGDRMSFQGGISKFIGQMDEEQLRTHLDEVFRTGSPGGGFIAYSEGSIPVDMPPERVRFYLDLMQEMSHRYGRGQQPQL